MKSKKRLKNTNGRVSQPEEPPVVFLDRTFGRNELAEMLRATDFPTVVTIYEEYGNAESKIADPVIIYDCGLKNRVLLTGDQDLIYTWAKEIIEAGIAVIVTTNQNEGPKQWGPRIIAAKNDMMRELRRRRKPFTAKISKEGRISSVRVYDGAEWRTINIGKKNPSNFQRRNKSKS